MVRIPRGWLEVSIRRCTEWQVGCSGLEVWRDEGMPCEERWGRWYRERAVRKAIWPHWEEDLVKVRPLCAKMMTQTLLARFLEWKQSPGGE